MIFSQQEREQLARLADVLIPAVGKFAAASQADVGGRGLDLILDARPDLAEGLHDLVCRASDGDSAVFVAKLQATDPVAFGVLTEFAAAAYFLNPEVLTVIGYSGQNARPIDPHPDYLDDGLLESVIQRGPIYRSTPKPNS